MTSFTSLFVTPLVCDTVFELDLGILKKQCCYQLTTKTVNFKTVIKPSDFRLKEAATGGVL